MPMITRAYFLSAIAAICLFLPACSTSKTNMVSFPIGEKVLVGKLSYQVVDAQWQTEVAGLKQPPKNRILQLHLMVTNSGAAEVFVPLLRVIDATGKEIGELSEIEGNPRWLGMIRRMQPALTEEGFLFFDVPVGAYKLEVVDNSVADSEKAALIEIPASLAPPPTIPGAKGS
jgi:hypothetical protein